MLERQKEFKLPEVEEKVLEFWKRNKIFEKSLELRKDAKSFRFFEGPPSANGQPGTHHVLSRSFKDIILRYKAMRGFFVLRKAGWDTHGLPVEIAVEKELGIKNKAEIEKLGIAEFNSRAKMLVWKYKNDWEKLSERIGFWLDFKNPYITYDNSYIESLWWIFKKIYEAGYLKKLYKVVAWCPRCQTPLSNHELGQPDVYQKTKDPSIYVKFQITNSKSQTKKREYLLVWTTTPWTLPANLFVAVNPKLTYTKFAVKYAGKTEYLWSYNPPPKVEGAEVSVVQKIAGSKLVGMRYKPLYLTNNQQPTTKNYYQVAAADFVKTEEGTGLVHVAPAFGEEDLNLWQKANGKTLGDIPVTIDERGFVKKGFPGAGKFIKEADKDIIADLEKRGLLYLAHTLEHEYPFCWRCGKALIYFARLTWFIEMSRLRDELLDANQKINWIPAHLKEGRFGEWLKEVKDWSISRERYWGTPLPIWGHANSAPPHSLRSHSGNAKAPMRIKETECDKLLVIGSFGELETHAYYRNRFLLARHTEAESNVRQIACGPETRNHICSLTKRGLEQAKVLAQEFKDKKVDLIFSSPLSRARETAKIIAQATKAKVIVDQRIGELNHGILNGRGIQELHKYFANFEERFTRRFPSGENWDDVRRRMMGFLKDINRRYQNKNIVIVSHGDPLWILEATLKGISNDKLRIIEYPSLGGVREVALPNQPWSEEGFLDVHRPYVDEVILKCPDCGKKMKRVSEVADVWFDSGAMPYASWHYPFENKELINRRKQFPADYIAEGVDQTRGWFYTLLAISVLLKMGPPYLNVISTGLVLDKYGQKMSKSKGNVVDPWAMIRKYGADVIRWYFFTINDPGDPKKFDEADLAKMFRKFHLLLYNSFVFLRTYSPQARINADSNADLRGNISRKPTNLLDRWIIVRWQEILGAATKKLDRYEVGGAARLLEEFVDDLSHWYIRRSRKRFSDPENAKDFNSAAATLNFVLLEMSKALAPFCPFFAEALYQSLINQRSKISAKGGSASGGKDQNSVHLENWPEVEKKFIDKNLLKAVSEVRKIASLALALRAEAGIKVRQPLAALKIKDQRLKIKNNSELLEMLKDEINVKGIVLGAKIKKELELDTTITPELYKEGMMREMIRLIQKHRQEAGYKVGENIYLRLNLPKEFKAILEENLEQFKKAVKARRIDFVSQREKSNQKLDLEAETKLDGQPVVIGMRR